MKGQTAAVTATLITGLTVAAVASTYIWGVPLIEKQQEEAEIRELENQMIDVMEALDSAREGGAGSVQTEELDLGNGEVRLNEEHNFLEFHFPQGGDTYPDRWTLIEGSSLQDLSFGAGDYGQIPEDQAGIIAVRGDSEGGSATFRIEYRNRMTDELGDPRLEFTELNAEGATTEFGQTEIRFENAGQSTDQHTVGGGEVYPRDKTEINVDFR